VSYPDDWSRVREAISADSRPGDVASFPWTAFRRFDWNDGRTVLDPAPRWLTRPTVVSDDLAVQTSTGVIVVPGDDPRARGIGDALEAGRPLGEVLVGLGIGWALVAEGTPGPTPDLPGWDRVVDGETLVLYAAPGGAIAPRSAGLPLVVAVDALVFGGLMIGLGALTIRRVRRVRARGAGPLVR
jgi:hypothetical protein